MQAPALQQPYFQGTKSPFKKQIIRDKQSQEMEKKSQ